MTQKQITFLTDKSKSTVSRALELLVDQGFCDYALEDNERGRAERKYFVKGSFKEVAIARAKKSLTNNNLLKKQLQQIVESLPGKEINHNQGLLSRIELFCELIDVLVITEEKTIEIFQQHYVDDD
ncbi:MAG: MarR family transcriptional regulator [Candidatus Hodarchaeales archaeon]